MIDTIKFFERTVRPALQHLGWGTTREFNIHSDPVFADEVGVAFACHVPENRPFVITLPATDDPSNALRWAGNVGYNLGSSLVLSATRQRAVLLAPHMVRREDEPASKPDVGYDLFQPAVTDVAAAVPLVLQDTVGGDLDAQLRRLSIHPNDLVAASARRGVFKESGYRPRASVDEALLQSLVRARVQVLREEEIEAADRGTYLNLDDSLLVLIGALLFLRGVEDRGERDELPRGTLWNISESPDGLEAVNRVINVLQDVYGKAALPLVRTDWTSLSPIRRLVQDLYYDSGRGAQFDFRLLDEDILARLYEQYLQFLYVDREQIPQIQLFGKEDRIRLNVRQEFGIYYTPRAVVDVVLSEVRNRLGPVAAPPAILEPACGAGAFLRPAFHWLQGDWPDSEPQDLAAQLIGVDVDPRAVTLTQQSLARSFVELTGSAQHVQIALCDFLETDVEGPLCNGVAWNRQFDAVVGNPPFLAHAAGKKIDAERLSRYRQTFSRATGGKPNLASFFVLQALKLLRPGGVLGMVVPRLLLRGPEYAAFRAETLREAELLSVVDFGTNHVFEDPDITTALLFLRKRDRRINDPCAEEAAGVFVVRYRDDFAPLIAESLQGRASSVELHGTLLEATSYTSGGAPWLLLTPEGRKAQALLTGGRVPISEMLKSQYTTDVMAGNGRALFVRPFDQSPNEDRVRVISDQLGRVFDIERRLLRKALTSDHIGRYRLQAGVPPVYLFYPYDPESGEAIPLEDFEPALPGRPGAREFVDALSPMLKGIRGNRTGSAWYGPGGTRVNAPWHARSVRENYAPTVLVWRRFSRIAYVSAVESAEWVPVGSMLAFSIEREYAGDTERLLAFLNSSLANWYAIMTTPKFGAGGWADRAMNTFRDLAFPSRFFDADLNRIRSSLDLLRNGTHVVSPAQIMRAEREVDDWVYDAFEIDRLLRKRLRWEGSVFAGNAALISAEERATAGVSLEADLGVYLEANE